MRSQAAAGGTGRGPVNGRPELVHQPSSSIKYDRGRDASARTGRPAGTPHLQTELPPKETNMSTATMHTVVKMSLYAGSILRV